MLHTVFICEIQSRGEVLLKEKPAKVTLKQVVEWWAKVQNVDGNIATCLLIPSRECSMRKILKISLFASEMSLFFFFLSTVVLLPHTMLFTHKCVPFSVTLIPVRQRPLRLISSVSGVSLFLLIKSCCFLS